MNDALNLAFRDQSGKLPISITLGYVNPEQKCGLENIIMITEP